MLFRDYVKRYIREHDLEPSTAQQYHCTVSNLDKWFGRPVDIETHLTTDLVNDYLHAMKEAGRSSYTRKSRRNNIVVLWRAIQADPRIPFNEDYSYIQRVSTHELDIDCFMPDDIEALLRHCGTLTGTIPTTSIPRTLYWRSFVLANWDSALRLGDLLRFTADTVQQIASQDGYLLALQNKNKRYVDCFFAPQTVEAMQDTSIHIS